MNKNLNEVALLSRSRGVSRARGAAFALALSALAVGTPHLAGASPLQSDAAIESMLAARPGDIVLGPAQAPVTIVTYTEHHNNGYAASWMNSWRPLRQKYGNSVRIIVRDYILAHHQGAEFGASAAHGVFERRGEAAYLNFVEALTAPQLQFEPHSLAVAAERVGAGPAPAFESALDSDVWVSRIGSSKADIQTASINGMPTTFINGLKFRGASRLDQITVAIDAELTAARALEAQQNMHGARLSIARTRINVAATADQRAADAAPKSRDDRYLAAIRARQDIASTRPGPRPAPAPASAWAPDPGPPLPPPPANGEGAVLRTPPVLVPGRSLGPFTLGQSSQEVVQLGFRMRQMPLGRLCIATNVEDDMCTFFLVFHQNRLTRLEYNTTAATLGFKFNGRRIPQNVDFSDLERALGCTPGEPAEGGSTSTCSPGLNVSMGTGGRCGSYAAIRPEVPCGSGFMGIVSVKVFEH